MYEGNFILLLLHVREAFKIAVAVLMGVESFSDSRVALTAFGTLIHLKQRRRNSEMTEIN
jgi:hypothetical protein